MTLSINSKMKDLLADEKAKAILDKQNPGWTDDPQIQPAMEMSFKELASHIPEATDEKLKEVDEELSKL